MDSDIELWNSRRKKVVAEEDLDPADFENLLLENRDAYSTHDRASDTQGDVTESSESMDLSILENEKIRQKLLESEKGAENNQKLDLIAHTLSSEKLDDRLIIGILWDGSDSASAEKLFHALPRSSRIVYLVEQAVSNRYLALELEEIRRYTNIPVIEAIDGLAVLPGRIYLGPYKQQLTLEDGYIKLQLESSQPSLSEISLGFFSSIAESKSALPVAIIFDSSHDRQGLLADETDRSLVTTLSHPQNKDLIYAETVNTLINAGGHVFFQDPDLHQSEIIVTNDSGHAAAIKAPASEISVSLQRLLHGEQLDNEPVEAVTRNREIVDANEEDKVEIDVQATWETETILSAEVRIQPDSSTQTPPHTQSQKQENEEVVANSNEIEIDRTPVVEEPVESEDVQSEIDQSEIDQSEIDQSEIDQSEIDQSEKIETGIIPSALQTEVKVLKNKIEALQTQNAQLEEENTELIEICQTMDIEDEAANLKNFFGSDPDETPLGTLLLLDKSLKLRSFNRAAMESILKVDYMEIGQSMFKLFSAKQIDYKEVRTLETQIQASLNMGRTNYGEPIAVDLNYKNKVYSISIVPMQARAGKPIGVALSWLNI